MDDPLEQFRKNFFDTLQKEKEEKERILKLKQKNCWHLFVLVNRNKICKKCGKLI
uniref:Uncharacterized protein n=1 Tax=viral metagenome TaxID=1070528 RepID=A0A6C0IE25_9ZZZZ